MGWWFTRLWNDSLLVSITAPFNNMRSLKFKAQQTNGFFASVNEVFGGSSQLPTTAEHCFVVWTVLNDLTTSRSEAGREEPPNLWLTVAIKRTEIKGEQVAATVSPRVASPILRNIPVVATECCPCNSWFEFVRHETAWTKWPQFSRSHGNCALLWQQIFISLNPFQFDAHQLVYCPCNKEALIRGYLSSLVRG